MHLKMSVIGLLIVEVYFYIYTFSLDYGMPEVLIYIFDDHTWKSQVERLLK